MSPDDEPVPRHDGSEVDLDSTCARTTRLAPGRFTTAEQTTGALGGALLGVPRLPWTDAADDAPLPFVDVADPTDPSVLAQLVDPDPGEPAPALRTGDVLAERYEVLGCLAHGGLGWVYLARDHELDGIPVALKGMIDADDSHVADAERRTLTELNHPNIVRIFGFATHPDPHTGRESGYLVMEYVGGLSLRDALRRIADGGEPLGRPLLAEHVVRYAQELLDALHYLHSQGWLYCDLKPDNVIHGGHRVKLIDLGATRKVGDATTALSYTPRYQRGDDEFLRHGVTVRTDLHALGVTLRELLDASADSGAGETAVAFGVRSLRHALARATAPFERRFASARDMAATLDGVLRELESLRDGQPRPAPSVEFAETAAMLDGAPNAGGLGAVPALDRWTAVRAESYTVPPLDHGLPSPSDAAILLPPPRTDPADIAAPFLADLRAPSDSRALLHQLNGVGHDSVELALTRCRAHVDLHEYTKATARLREAEQALGDAAAVDWRVGWHRGLIQLGLGDITRAEGCFEIVYRALPGEAAPKVALGYCAEHEGRLDDAASFYRAVWARDHGQVSSAFGLARLRLAQGDRPGAVDILDDVPEVSLYRSAAGIAAVRVLAGRLASGFPTAAELAAARRRLSGLSFDDDISSSNDVGDTSGTSDISASSASRASNNDVGGTAHEPSGPSRDRVAAELDETALALAHGTAERRRARRNVEARFFALARQARDPDGHGVLIDLAHLSRPRTRI